MTPKNPDEKIRVLFAAFEAVPFVKTGGLGDVAGSLPSVLARLGADARLIMPKFKSIPERYKSKMTHVADFYMPLGWRNSYVGIESLTLNKVTVYFIDNEYYFRRDMPYGYYDDGERAAYFSKACLHALKYLDFSPHIIHCNDWHTALIPAFLKGKYGQDVMKAAPGKSKGRPFSDIRTVFTIHNLKFQGMFSGYMIGDVLGFNRQEAENLGLIYNDDINFMRSALALSDRITTVSPSYAEEILTDFYGEHAQDILNSRRDALSGITNGINVRALNPMTDRMIPAHYGSKDCLPGVRTSLPRGVKKKKISEKSEPLYRFPEGKAECKRLLQAELGLQAAPDKPIYSIISRLTNQKGLDLVLRIIDEFMELDVQFVALGVGDSIYEEKFLSMNNLMPSRFAARLYFDEALAHRIYAGADFVLVPSLYEPCGLTQIIAMRYGTLPVVRETGGLKDTVIPYNKYSGEGTGFSFANYNAHELLFCMKDTYAVYKENPEAFRRLVYQAMSANFSWSVSGRKYLALYEELV